jgi:hypothetical protein
MLDLTATYALPITSIHSMVVHNQWVPPLVQMGARLVGAA